MPRKIITTIEIVILLGVISACGRENPISGNVSQPTAIPEGLRIFRAHDGEIGIEWLRFYEPDLKGYNVYRAINDSTNFMVYAFTTDNFFLDDSLEYDSVYYYKLTSVNNNGDESSFSDFVSAKPLNLYPPFPPFLNTVVGMNRSGRAAIEINWIPSASSDVKEYRIFRSLTKDDFKNTKELIGATKGAVFTDTLNLVLLQKYYYAVVAIDKGGLESSQSLIMSDLVLDVPVPISPVNQQVKDYELIFKFISCSGKAKYKLFIQSDQYFDIVDILNIDTELIRDTVSVSYNTLYLNKYKEYYWRVAAYTASDETANSFSDLNSFSIVYGNN